jgi:hypothetical protein
MKTNEQVLSRTLTQAVEKVLHKESAASIWDN